MYRLFMMAIVAILAAACSAAPAGTPIVIYVTPEPASLAPVSGSVPPATAGAAATVAPTPAITVAPSNTFAPATSVPPQRTVAPRTPAATAGLSVGEAVLQVWSSSGYITAQVIAPVENTGNTWVEVLQFDSSWTIYGADGGITATGSYLDALAPRLLGPGESGYVVAEEFTDEFARADFDRAEAAVYYSEVPPGLRLETSNVRVRAGSFGGVEVSGEISNPGSERIDSVSVVAIFLGADGEILGYAQGSAENVEPGGKRAFEASSSFAEIRQADIDETLVFASDDSF